MPLIDSHCHLNYDYLPKTDSDLVREANEKGVEQLITVGTDMKTLAEVAAISRRHENVFHTVGVHPHDAKDMEDPDIETLQVASADPKCVAIGEIGLDYHYDHSPRNIQIRRLRDQLDLAVSVGLPVVIHARDAEEDLSEVLEEYVKSIKKEVVPGVIHCFTGTQAFGEKCLDLGFYISFSGILTFKKSETLRASAGAFPIERLLVETDSPYLAPVPYRGKQCEPSMVVKTAECLAEIKGLSFEAVAKATAENTRRVFNKLAH